MITMVSHGDICCIGANVDPAAITDTTVRRWRPAKGSKRSVAEARPAEPGRPAPVITERA